MAIDKLYLQAILLIINLTFSTSIDTIAISQTIKDGDLLISKANNFALGFFSPGKSSFRYLGVWYHKLRQQTVVWVANRNSPINGSSGILSVLEDGKLVLYSSHDRQVPVWSANVSVEANNTCVARLLDSGNLVLVEDASKRVVWQSFDFPTDTLLPGMKLGLNRKTGSHRFLTSWKSADDPGIGEYSLEINPIGNLQVFIYKGRVPIWRGMPGPSRTYVDISNYTIVSNPDEVSISYFVLENSVIITTVLDYSGSHKHLTWHETEGTWKEIWSVPKYQCDTYRHCGVYSRCDPTHVDNAFECDCLPGFEPKYPKNWNVMRDGSGGCVRKRRKSYTMCTNGEGFLKVERVKLPDTSTAVWMNRSSSSKDCEQECRNSCSCTAYASIDVTGKGAGCFVWLGELIDTVDGIDAGHDLYVRVDAVELEAYKRAAFLGIKGVISVLVACVASAWCVIIFAAYMLLKRKRKKERTKKRLLETFGDSYSRMKLVGAKEAKDSASDLDIGFFSLRTIVAATNNFSSSNKIGQGGFGSVYKGQLPDGQEIAVKMLGRNSGQGLEEFKNEAILIAKLQHKNLVKLIGCCIEGEEPMLIYEYLSNKCLDSLLFDKTRRSILDWRRRFDIIMGIARGILYLHQDSRLTIIHRDLKTSNILLDEEMNPKISDFGLARIFRDEQIQAKTNKVAGTFGYMSPEYVLFGKFSIKSDVYSYGVILLEIIAGKKNNNFCQKDSSLTLIGYVWELWKEDRALDITDRSLQKLDDYSQVLRCIQIGLLCVQASEKDRPTMFDVVLMLSSQMSLPSPKEPAFIVKKVTYNSSKFATREERSCSINEMTITSIISR